MKSPLAALCRIKRRPLLFLLVILSTAVLPAGSVYVAKYESQADAKVFVVKYESQADLCVRLVRYESQANDADEFWHYVKYESQAVVKIVFVEHESQADIRIFFVHYDSQAGWRRENPFQGRLH
ncbi:MAG TPA: DUF6150 family protein [Patescibacteria group bacterium]|nr:DUF6150 family protein [Patescibacteria group bacterium]